MESRIHPRCSSCWSRQLFGVETRSLLPHGQSDTGDLACQGQTSQGRSHSTLHPRRIKITQAPRRCAGRDSSTFEQILPFLIVVFVQTTHPDALTIGLQFPANLTVLAAIMRLDGETAVGPELALAAETVGCLQQCHPPSCPNRTNRWNLPK
jgi:hypothetical protein